VSCTDGDDFDGSQIPRDILEKGSYICETVASGNHQVAWRPYYYGDHEDVTPLWGCRKPGMTRTEWMLMWSIACLGATGLGIFVLLYNSLRGFDKSVRVLRNMTEEQQQQHLLSPQHNSAGAATLCFFLFGVMDMVPKSLLVVSMWKLRMDNTAIVSHPSIREWIEMHARYILLVCFLTTWALTSLASGMLAYKIRSAMAQSSQRTSRLPSARFSFVEVEDAVVHGPRIAATTLLSSLTRIESMAILRLRLKYCTCTAEGKRCAPLIRSDHEFMFVRSSGMYQYLSKDIPHILVSIALLRDADDDYLVDVLSLTHRSIAIVSLIFSILSVIFGLISKCHINQVRKQVSREMNSFGSELQRKLRKPLLEGEFNIADLQPATWKKTIVGKGSYGTVYQAKWKGDVVAVKELKLPRGAELFDAPHPDGMHTDQWNDMKSKFIRRMELTNERFIREIKVWKDLNHPNLVAMLGYATELHVGGMYIMQELMAGKSLAEQLYRRRPKWQPTPTQIAELAVGLAEGMKYLHSRDPPLIHRDLKCTNVLLSADATTLQACDHMQGLVKIADFGLARQMADSYSSAKDTLVRNSSGMSLMRDRDDSVIFLTTMGTSVGNMGSLPWRAPETFDEETPDTTELDVYSYAMCLVEMVDQHPPWHGKKPTHIQTRVLKGERPRKQVEALQSTQPELLRLIEECWKQDLKSRPTFEKILNDPALIQHRRGGNEPEPEPEDELLGGYGGSE
jgi:serine/threonine protein kinase